MTPVARPDVDIRVERRDTIRDVSSEPSQAPASVELPLALDLELFEALNEEYRERPLVRRPPAQDPRGYRERAASRATSILRHVPVEGRDVLELGCGHGWLSRTLAEDFGARNVIGVDIAPYPAWEKEHASRPDVQLVAADVAATPVAEPGSIDTIVSTAVFEHVRRPVETLATLAGLLREGGVAWLYFNLHRGPKASHRYREVFFPWPHLLFEEEVGDAFYLKHLGKRRTWSWVNHMTVGNYLETVRELGLTVKHLRRSATPIDIPLYRRFEDVLGRYPALDLESDFLTLVLEKGGDGHVPPAGYLERERAFREQLAEADAAPTAVPDPL